MIRRRTGWGIALVATLATLSWVLSRGPGDGGGAPVKPLDTQLNYALYDFSGRLLNDGGEISLRIDAPLLRNNALSGVGTVVSPEIHIQQESDQWYITAESAIITADREHVSLLGKVNMIKRNMFTGLLLEIQTQDVMLNVTPRTASTEAPVSIRQAGDQLDATGMRLDMISEHYELLDKVRAIYETS
ncbi:MAG: LPS export ABC transporter periplasmic protein LptC [Xanthomonadales bacterium]|nr:LPS export ABC transporter periplasmic protein LptC [Xanthomonadales bacterium]